MGQFSSVMPLVWIMYLSQSLFHLLRQGSYFSRYQYSILSGTVLHGLRVFLNERAGNTGHHGIFKKYGISALIPGMLLAGFYICPVVGWLPGWDRKIAFILMMGTSCAASVFLLPVSGGLIQWMTSLAG